MFRGHSAREPASGRVTYFILRAYTGIVECEVSINIETKRNIFNLKKYLSFCCMFLSLPATKVLNDARVH